MSESAELTIIVDDDDLQFSLWPTHHTLPLGWRFTGLTGTQAEMEAWLLQFIETAPPKHDPLYTPFSTSQWEDTESGARLA